MKLPRKPSVSGLFYPADPSTLKGSVAKYISQAKIESNRPVKLLIVPHAGYTYSGKIAGEGYAEVREGDYDHVVLLGPSHRHYFKGMAESGEHAWQTPLGDIGVKKLNLKEIEINSPYHKDEHCLEVQVPFIKYLFPNALISPILLSGPHSQAVKMAESLFPMDTQDTLWVVSSDFNHTGPNFRHYPLDYGFSSGESMDHRAVDFITSGDINGFHSYLDETNATICGALPILVAMHLIKKLKLPSFTFKKYDCSGRQTGDSSSVGYATLYC